MSITTATLFISPLPFTHKRPSPSITTNLFPSLKFNSVFTNTTFKHNDRPFIVKADEGDADSGGPDGYDTDEQEVEEVDNKKDYDVEYDPLAAASAAAAGDGEIAMVQSKSFVHSQGWDSEMVVDYRINEDEFHKISLLDCDFFIRRPPDPDNDVYDFREMYVTPPDTDVYAIPKVLAPMPQKVFLTKHYRNRRLHDPEFVLDFEEIYVIDSKTKSISRAKVVVTVPGGRNRDRKSDLLVIRNNGTFFKIVHASEKDDPTTVIEREEWAKTREDMEKHLRKLRDFSVSNWF